MAVASGFWLTVTAWGCGDLIGVGSLTGERPADADGALSSEGAQAATDGVTGGRSDVAAASDASTGAASNLGPDAPLGVGDVAMGAETAAALDGNEDGMADPCATIAPSQWISWSSSDAPDGAYYIGRELIDPNDLDGGYYALYVCRARDADDAGFIIPGKFVDTYGCFYTPDQVMEVPAQHFEVLLDPGGCLTLSTYSGSLPPNALVAGALGQAPLYVCTAPLTLRAPDQQTGYLQDVPDASCVISDHGNVYEIDLGIQVLTTK